MSSERIVYVINWLIHFPLFSLVTSLQLLPVSAVKICQQFLNKRKRLKGWFGCVMCSQVDKVKNLRGGAVSFPEGGCQFFFSGGDYLPLNPKKILPAALVTF